MEAEVCVDKKKWLAAGAVGLVSGILVVAAFASRSDSLDPTAEVANPGAASQDASAAAGQDPGADNPATPGGQGTNDPGASGANGQSTTPTSGAGDPTSGAVVAPTGQQLQRVTQPPEHTLAMLNADAATPGAVYDIVFEPYGTGPQSSSSSVAALVVSAKMRDGAEGPNLNKRNVLLLLGPGEVVAKGGSYAAVLTLTARGETLVPIVSNVRPSSK